MSERVGVDGGPYRPTVAGPSTSIASIVESAHRWRPYHRVCRQLMEARLDGREEEVRELLSERDALEATLAGERG